MEDNDFLKDFDVIHVYTRSNAIEDGVLIDVSELADECGIKYPVAVTSTVWEGYIKVNEELKSRGQSEEGRLWDLLWMFRSAALKEKTPQLKFQAYFETVNGKILVEFKALCGPGDEAEPVITIMMPEED